LREWPWIEKQVGRGALRGLFSEETEARRREIGTEETMRQTVTAFTLLMLVTAPGALACTGVAIAGGGHVVIGTTSHWRRGAPIA